MIGPIEYVLAPQVGQIIIFHNFGEAKVKISVQNHSAHAGASLNFATKAGSPKPVPDNVGVPPKSTVVFSIEETWLEISAFNASHNEGSAVISVIYD